MRVFVEVPKNLNGKQKSALKAFAEAMGETGYKTVADDAKINADTREETREEKGFFGKVKDAFSVD